jgi:hypothetical protein
MRQLMGLFSISELEKIREQTDKREGNILVTFNNKHGPTKLKLLWRETLQHLGFPVECISWWSSSGNIGLLECEINEEFSIFGQWALADENKLLGIFKMTSEEIVNIREGFDSGNVTSSAMRAIRIGETGDRD